MQVTNPSKMTPKSSSSILSTLLASLLIINYLQAECKTAQTKTESEKDFAPRISHHQAASVELNANEPHSIECPIEARPEGEVIWFHNGEKVTQHMANGREFLFLSLDERDTGDYQCQMTNYLGSLTSERFKLTVKSSVHDPRIRFEPRVAEVSPDEQVEFTCSIPLASRKSSTGLQQQQLQSRSSQDPEVMWRRDGKRLKVEWLDDGDELPSASDGPDSSYWTSRFFARRLASGEFVLVITRAHRQEDNNATFTCLYRPPDSTGDGNGAKDSQSELPKESSPVRLRVYPVKQNTGNGGDQIKLVDANLGPPITEQELTDKRPHEIPTHSTTIQQQQQQQSKHNYTTQLIEPGNGQQQRRVNSLKQTLEDLYEIARPALIIFGLLVLVSTLVLLQLLYIRRRTRQNRYMKHQYGGGCSSSGTNSSGASSSGVGGLAAGLDCDPVLNSLMARTLSAPTGGSLGVAGRKFRSYRDHLRKVAAANTDHHHAVNSADLLDSAGQQQQQQHYFQQHAEDPFFQVNAASVSQQAANLYSQSLAAREQAARCLLQAASGADHMRSLSNLAAMQHQQQQGKQMHNNKQQQQQHNGLRLSQNGSHLNLPLSFAFGANRTSQDEAQLMASAFWPSHLAAQLTSRNNQQQQPLNRLLREQSSKQQDENYQLVNCASSSISPSSTSSIVKSNINETHSDIDQHQQSLNHYSTIDNDNYEEVDLHQATKGNRGHFNNKQDQPSPYAVSSICANMTQHQQSLPPPPMSAEAMRALNEQFDLNQLMLLDESEDQVTNHHQPTLPFSAPPPPPPQPPTSQQNDNDENENGSEQNEQKVPPKRK